MRLTRCSDDIPQTFHEAKRSWIIVVNKKVMTIGMKTQVRGRVGDAGRVTVAEWWVGDRRLNSVADTRING